MKTKKYVFWGLAVCLVMQIVVAGFAAAADPIPDDLTGESKYLIVHDTSGAYTDFGGPSVITVKKPDNSVITPSGGVYTNIPNGSKINLTYRFNLSDGVEPDIFTYTEDNFFTIELPEDISFNPPTGDEKKIYARDTTNPSDIWLLGTWEFADSNTIRVDFSDRVDDHKAIWGEIGISGTFNDIKYGDEDERTLILGSESILFRRTPPTPPQITLQKSGVYDATTNTIEWTVTVTPPTGWALDGYTLLDEYCKNADNQSFVNDSFYVGTTQIINTGASPDPNLIVDTLNKTVTYIFPDTDPNTTGVQTIKYKTSPKSFGSEDGSKLDGSADQSVFENYATLKHAADTLAGPVRATVTTDWVNKTGSSSTGTGGEIFIRWIVDITVPNSGTVTGGKIIDTIPKGLELVKGDASHPIQVIPNGGSASTIPEHATDWGTYSYSYTDVDHSSEFTYRFPSSGSVSTSARVSYYTKLTSRDHDLINNGSVSFSNHAEFIWDKQVSDSVDPPTDVTSVQVVGSGGLLSKSATNPTSNNPQYYNHVAADGDIIHWVITVNRNKVTMDVVSPGINAYVEDTIPAGQKLYFGTGDKAFVVKRNGTEMERFESAPSSGNLTSDDLFSNRFLYAFPTPSSDTYTLEYCTQIENVSTGLGRLYVNNNSLGFLNNIKLFFSGGKKADIDGTKRFSSQMIDKGVGTYSYSDHTVKWTVTVNRNRMPLTNATMTDVLPPGMDLVMDATHPFEVTVNGSLDASVHAPTSIATDGRSFTYNLAAKDVETQDLYTISFYTHLQDAQLETQWSGTHSYTNNAQLTGKEFSGHIDASAAVGIGNPVIQKDRKYETGSDSIDWSVSINAGLIPLKNAKVTDQLDPGLNLDSGSLKLYEVSVNPSNGAVGDASSGVLVTSGYTVDYPKPANNNTLTVHLPEGSSHAYRLEFTTYILSDDLDFINEAVLSGSTDSPDGDDDAQVVSVDNLWSSGGSGSCDLTVYKDDGSGHPVPGSIYQLLNFNKQPIIKNKDEIVTATTDAQGKAVFKNLPKWVYYAKEIYAPDGFLLNPDVIGGKRASDPGETIFNTADNPALGTLSFKKTTHKGAALSGGEFTLTGKSYAGKDITMKAASIGGTVTFTSVPIGTYTIRETSAPKGYFVSDTVLTATVEYADKYRLGVRSSLSADTIVDQPVPWEHFGSVKLKKTNQTGKVLPGATFGLYGSDGALVMTATSQKDGTVLFSNVPFGTYTIRETTAPKGYTVSVAELKAFLDEDGITVDAGTVVNMRNTGSPKTGDDIMGYFVLALIGLAGITVVYVINKRIKKIG